MQPDNPLVRRNRRAHADLPRAHVRPHRRKRRSNLARRRREQPRLPVPSSTAPRINWHTPGILCNPDALRAPDSDLVDPVNALCITLYNETLQELESTIISAVASLKRFHEHSASGPRTSAICLIADGAATVRTEITTALTRWGFLTERPSTDPEGTLTHSTLHDTDRLLARLRPELLTLPSGTKSRIAVCVAIKSVNRGKLHSHRLFFSRFCPALNPGYCYQIDAGTILHGELITLLVERMRRGADIGGVAPQVTPAVPHADASFLARWQFFDFAFRVCIEWPFEVLTGFLSVLPGQVCALRWHALRGNAPERGDPWDAQSPIRAYLEGIEAVNATDRIRYLAEDRVIGTSLMFSRQGAWRLAYVPQAVGTTDRCTSLMELLRQRRRWNNSSLITRFWLCLQIPAFLGRRDRSFAEKTGLLGSVAGQMLIASRDFFGPAVLSALVIALVWQAATASTKWGQLACIAYLVATAADIAVKAYTLVTNDERAPAWLASGQKILDYTCPLMFVPAVLSFSWPVALLLLVPALGLVPSALLLPRCSLGLMLRQQLSPITMLAMSCSISTYAFLNMHDVSWGTKGLMRATVRASMKQNLRQMRNRMLGWWALGNLALLGVALATQAVGELNVLTLTVCALEGVLAISGVAYLIAHGRRR
jgi:chitin synthase